MGSVTIVKVSITKVIHFMDLLNCIVPGQIDASAIVFMLYVV